MYPTRTMIVQISHPMKCDIASTFLSQGFADSLCNYHSEELVDIIYKADMSIVCEVLNISFLV